MRTITEEMRNTIVFKDNFWSESLKHKGEDELKFYDSKYEEYSKNKAPNEFAEVGQDLIERLLDLNELERAIKWGILLIKTDFEEFDPYIKIQLADTLVFLYENGLKIPKPSKRKIRTKNFNGRDLAIIREALIKGTCIKDWFFADEKLVKKIKENCPNEKFEYAADTIYRNLKDDKYEKDLEKKYIGRKLAFKFRSQQYPTRIKGKTIYKTAI